MNQGRIITAIIGFGLMAMVVTVPVLSQPPGGEGKGEGKGGPPRFEVGQVLPGPLVAELNLTPAQAKELETIRKDLKAKLDKLLTSEQKKTIENFRPKGMGGAGGKGGGGDKGGKGGPGEKGMKGGGKGGSGEKGEKGGPGEKGAKGGDQPVRPPIEKDPPPLAKAGSDAEKNGSAQTETTKPEAIQWYATLPRGLEEARRTGKPILFVSAAPHCAGVSGMW